MPLFIIILVGKLVFKRCKYFYTTAILIIVKVDIAGGKLTPYGYLEHFRNPRQEKDRFLKLTTTHVIMHTCVLIKVHQLVVRLLDRSISSLQFILLTIVIFPLWLHQVRNTFSDS